MAEMHASGTVGATQTDLVGNEEDRSVRWAVLASLTLGLTLF